MDKKARIEENELAMGWVGNIKKAFQEEQMRLKGQGVTIRFKPVWQSINDTMWLIKKRQKKLKSLK